MKFREALHLSEEERSTVMDCFHKIEAELKHGIDRHSRRLICANIGLLLDYCMRFYERQFVTREEVNKDVIVRFERLLDEYFDSDAHCRKVYRLLNILLIKCFCLQIILEI